MSITVTCPKCLTRFTVSEKFAGKSGPCPKCRSTIQVPKLSEQVVIHAPVDTAPKDSRGRSVLTPIRRQEVKVSWPMTLTAAVGGLSILMIAWGFRLSGLQPSPLLLGLGAPIIALPLVVGGYWFLRDEELQGFVGHELWIRCGICALIFAIGWLLYSWLPGYVSGHSSTAQISVFEMAWAIALMIGLGTAAAVLTLELEIPQGLLLYMLYFVSTFVLAWLSGAPLSEALPGTGGGAPILQQPLDSSQSGAPGEQTPPIDPKPSGAETPKTQPDEPAKRDIPKLLQ